MGKILIKKNFCERSLVREESLEEIFILKIISIKQ